MEKLDFRVSLVLNREKFIRSWLDFNHLFVKKKIVISKFCTKISVYGDFFLIPHATKPKRSEDLAGADSLKFLIYIYIYI